MRGCRWVAINVYKMIKVKYVTESIMYSSNLMCGLSFLPDNVWMFLIFNRLEKSDFTNQINWDPFIIQWNANFLEGNHLPLIQQVSRLVNCPISPRTDHFHFLIFICCLCNQKIRKTAWLQSCCFETGNKFSYLVMDQIQIHPIHS